MRRIILLAVGVVVGAAGGISVVNTLRQRDAYPRGLMDVMQHHYSAMRDEVRRGRCEDSAQHMTVLRELETEIGSAVYGDDIPDASFREFLGRLRDAVAAPPSSDCKALAAIAEKISAACDSCHREYR